MGVFHPSRHPVMYCSTAIAINWMSNTCSTLFLLNLTFDRFYSIMKPHKASSINTSKRAKITVAVCATFSILYNSPHLFISSYQTGQCVPFEAGMKFLVGKIYYWFSYGINFVLPFVLLLTMNSFIIATIRRSRLFRTTTTYNQGHGKSEGQSQKTKTFEKQTYVILFLVTFGFLILVTPSYLCILYINLVDYQKSAKSFAEFYFIYHLAQKLFFTNYGINFYLYVISGLKFRTDLLNLCNIMTKFRSENTYAHSNNTTQTQVSTVSSTEQFR